jgi:hypothetical protein
MESVGFYFFTAQLVQIWRFGGERQRLLRNPVDGGAGAEHPRQGPQAPKLQGCR